MTSSPGGTRLGDLGSDAGLARLAQAGDTAAEEILLRRYAPYARTKARAYFLPGGDPDDVVQEGMIGLVKAVRDFDPLRASPFRAFAELCVSRQVQSAVKAAGRHKHAILSAAVRLDWQDHDGVTEGLPAGPDSDPLEAAVCAEDARAMRARVGALLTGLERQVLDGYLRGGTYREIAADLELPVKTVDNAVQRVKRKLAAARRRGL